MDVLHQDRRISVLANDLDPVALERELIRWMPLVVVVDETERFLLGRLRAIQPATGVVVLAHSPSPELGMRLLGYGVTCLAYSTAIADIVAAIHLTAQGGRVFASPSGDPVESGYPIDAIPLTPREIEVLEAIIASRTNAQIARELHISVETVKSHVASLRRKLNAKSKRELSHMFLPARVISGSQ
jgi:DNA-binding NarL/FixJ family response regulator